jgi:acetyltransferase-like isoleucine patch superfamily enzyme
MIHSTADVKTNHIGENTTVWQHVVILAGAVIGSDVNICAHCFIEEDVIIGDRVTVKSGVYLWNGVRLADDVFIGPNVTFTNDKYPRSKDHSQKLLKTVVQRGASVGGGAVLLPGITIGQEAIIGAGAVVTKSVPPFAIVTGSSAKITGYVDSLSPNPLENTPQVELWKNEVSRIGVGYASIHLLRLVSDMRGNLSIGEFPKDIPFDPKRYFVVFNVPSEKTRGEHAHYRCHQFLVCLSGSCAVVVDDGYSRCEVVLNSPNKGLYLPPLTWGIQYKYSVDAVLLVFASDFYEPEDYIRNYSDFQEIVRSNISK